MRCVLLPDIHSEYGTEDVLFKKTIKFIKHIKPDKVIYTGDALNMSVVSHWLHADKRQTENLRIKNDYNKFNRYTKEIKSSCGQQIFMIGNHEDWIRQAIEKEPGQLEGYIEPENNLEYIDEFVPNNEILKVEKLNIVHGYYTTATACKKHATEFMDNVVFCHTHRIGSWFFTPISKQPIAAWNIGSLCEMNPYYAKNKKPNWQSGFAVVDFRGSGSFQLNQIVIIDRKFVFEGRLY